MRSSKFTKNENDLVSSLYKKHNYLNKCITFINNSMIVEYDMHNAGLSILHHNGIIDDENFNYLQSLDKLQKNITVGKFLRDNSDANDFLVQEFVNVRKEFFTQNNINDDSVLAIKKDAIFLINKSPHVLKLNDDYEFIKKNIYNSYININGKEHYYSMNDDILDTKGYSKEIKEFHKNYLFKFLKECLKIKMPNNDYLLTEKLLVFKNEFVEKSLDIGYYNDILFGGYLVDICGNVYTVPNISNTENVIINNNLNFLLELINKIL